MIAVEVLPAPAEELLARHAALSLIAPEERAALACLLTPVVWQPGDLALREGDPGDGWYVIAHGMLALEQGTGTDSARAVAVLGPGESLGEAQLSAPSPWALSARAITEVQAFHLSLDLARDLRLRDLPVREILTARADLLAIAQFLRRASPFATLPDEALWLLLRRMSPRRLTQHEVLVHQNQSGQALFLLVAGAAEVRRGRRRIQRVGPGDVIGEMSLLSGAPASATVIATSDLDVLTLDREDFVHALEEHPSLRAFFEETAGIRAAWLSGQQRPAPAPSPGGSPQQRIRSWRHSPRAAWTLGVGTALFALLSVLASQAASLPLRYAVLAVGSLIGPVAFVLYLSERNVLRDSVRRLAICALLGAALSLPIALIVQRQLGIVSGDLRAALLIGTIEEIAKIVAVVWAVRNRYLRFETDGVMCGAAAGMGFAIVENLLYGSARLQTPGVLLETLWLRAFLSPFTHAAWTALACIGLWRARAIHSHAYRTITFLPLFAVAIGLHALWDWKLLAAPLSLLWLLIVGSITLLVLRDLHESAVRVGASSVLALDTAFAGPSGPHPRRCHVCGQRAPAQARYCPRCTVALRQDSQSVFGRPT